MTPKEMLWAAIVLVVLGGAGAGYYFYTRGQTEAAPPTTEQVPAESLTPSEVVEDTTPKYPVPEDAAGDATPLPPVNESDAVVVETLGGAFGKPTIEQFLNPQNVVRHFVVTVDNLPRKKLSVERRPVKPVAGSLIVSDDMGPEEAVTLGAANYARYAPMIQLLQSTETPTIVATYRRLYPLLQQAYEDLGYPGKHFNDRLVEVIDHLLETPDVNGPVKLVRPNVFYQYANPALEERSAGQKLLIRMGPKNAAIVKEKLRELRQAITTPAG